MSALRRRWTGRPRRGEFAPVSAELLIAIASTKMTDAARRCLLAIIASSYGRYREHDVPLRRTELEALTSLPHGQISKAIAELQRAGILTVEAPRSRGKRATYRIEKRYGDWTPPTVIDPRAETTWRSVPAASDGSHENGHDEPDHDRSHENGECSDENAHRSHENAPLPRVIGGEEEEGLEAATADPLAALEHDLDTPWPEPDQDGPTLPAGGPIITGRDLPPTASAAGSKRTRRQLTPGDDLEVARRAAHRRQGRAIVKAMREADCTPEQLEKTFGALSPDADQSRMLWSNWMLKEQGEWERRFDSPPMSEAEMDRLAEAFQPPTPGTDASTTGATP